MARLRLLPLLALIYYVKASQIAEINWHPLLFNSDNNMIRAQDNSRILINCSSEFPSEIVMVSQACFATCTYDHCEADRDRTRLITCNDDMVHRVTIRSKAANQFAIAFHRNRTLYFTTFAKHSANPSDTYPYCNRGMKFSITNIAPSRATTEHKLAMMTSAYSEDTQRHSSHAHIPSTSAPSMIPNDHDHHTLNKLHRSSRLHHQSINIQPTVPPLHNIDAVHVPMLPDKVIKKELTVVDRMVLTPAYTMELHPKRSLPSDSHYSLDGTAVHMSQSSMSGDFYEVGMLTSSDSSIRSILLVPCVVLLLAALIR